MKQVKLTVVHIAEARTTSLSLRSLTRTSTLLPWAHISLFPHPLLLADMADESQQRAVATAFAPPPPLWKHFTRENIDKLEQIKAEASKSEDGRLHKNKHGQQLNCALWSFPQSSGTWCPPTSLKGRTASLANCKPFVHLDLNLSDNTDLE